MRILINSRCCEAEISHMASNIASFLLAWIVLSCLKSHRTTLIFNSNFGRKMQIQIRFKIQCKRFICVSLVWGDVRPEIWSSHKIISLPITFGDIFVIQCYETQPKIRWASAVSIASREKLKEKTLYRSLIDICCGSFCSCECANLIAFVNNWMHWPLSLRHEIDLNGAMAHRSNTPKWQISFRQISSMIRNVVMAIIWFFN